MLADLLGVIRSTHAGPGAKDKGPEARSPDRTTTLFLVTPLVGVLCTCWELVDLLYVC